MIFDNETHIKNTIFLIKVSTCRNAPLIITPAIHGIEALQNIVYRHMGSILGCNWKGMKLSIQDRVFLVLPVMSEYHKMDTNKYPNIFGCHIMYRMNIWIYSDAAY